MKFFTALIALATAAMASPTSLVSRNDQVEHQKAGKGRYHGVERYCDNWVAVDKSLIAIDVDIDVCINIDLNLDLLGLINLGIDVNLDLDVEIDVKLLHQRYPTLSHLYCDPSRSCKKGKKIPVNQCWEHEFDQKKFDRYY